MNEHARVDRESDSSGHRARLRKRLLEAGPAGFHDYELIEYLLALTIPRVDTKPLAKRLIEDFGGGRAVVGRECRYASARRAERRHGRRAEDRRSDRAAAPREPRPG